MPHPRHRPGQRGPDRVRGDDLQRGHADDHRDSAEPRSCSWARRRRSRGLTICRASDTVRIELSRDGGGSYETLAAAVPITNTSTSGSFTWTVTGPATYHRPRARDRQRLAARQRQHQQLRDRRADADRHGAAAGATVYATSLSVAWTHNVGAQPPCASSSVGTVGRRSRPSRLRRRTRERSADRCPGPGTTDARIRVTTNGSVTATGTSDRSRWSQPTLAVTSPVAGATRLRRDAGGDHLVDATCPPARRCASS